MILRKKFAGDGAAFLLKLISSGVHKWKFYLTKVNQVGSGMTIGIWNTKYIPDVGECLYGMYEKCYAWMVTGQHLNCGWDRYGNGKPKDGDIIEMVLDLDKGTVQYFHNDVDLGIAYRNIAQKPYRAAVSMFHEEDCIELIEYQCLDETSTD